MKKKKLMNVITGAGIFLCLLAGGCAAKPTAQEDSETPEVSQAVQQEITLEEKTDASDDEEETYTWQEITVTIPEAWKDLYIIEESESGFAFYQKASYEKTGQLGYLCGFFRKDVYENQGAGETLVAYTDEGICYYLMQPTDVSCDVEDEELLEEYTMMIAQVPELKAFVCFSAQNIHVDAEEYELPLSSIELLTEDVLYNLSDNELLIARNEIYARHGRLFQNEYLQNYFNTCSWYQGTIAPEDFDEEVFSQLEKENLLLLTKVEEVYALQHPYPVECSYGAAYSEDLDGDGVAEQLTCELIKQENETFLPQITINGEVFTLEDSYELVTPVTDVFYVTNLSEYDDELEIAFLDLGGSYDPITYFFRYDGTLQYVGEVEGFPFASQNSGINGFTNQNGVIGRVRTDLIETAYLQGYWWFNTDQCELEYQELELYNYIPTKSHQLYEDLPVHVSMDEDAAEVIIPEQEEVFFLKSDLEEWILVKGKDGTQGYMHVKNGKVTDLGKSANSVFSDLEYFD